MSDTIDQKTSGQETDIAGNTSEIGENITKNIEDVKGHLIEKHEEIEEVMEDKASLLDGNAPEEPKTDVPLVSKQRAAAQKIEPKPNSRFSILPSITSLLLRRRVPPVLQLTAVECGAACLAMIMGYYGRQTRIAENS